MIRRATLAAAALALGAAGGARAQTRPALAAGFEGSEPVDIEADTITYDWDSRLVRLAGNVIVTRGDGVLRAGSGVLDRAANTLRLDGGVLAVQGHEVALADAALVDLTSRAAELTHAVLYLKQDLSPQLKSLTDPHAARGLGKNALTLTAQRIRQLPHGELLAQQVTLTPCDCAGTPDYELISDEAHVTGDRVALSSPRLHIGALKLPLFPLSLPLGERQSGLLFPKFGFSSTTGFAFAVPIFETLGRSYDLTLTPGFFTGSAGSGDPTLPRSAFNNRSVKGPRLGIGFDYAPTENSSGEIDLSLFQDLDRRDSPAQPAQTTPEEGAIAAGRGLPFANGLRGTLRFSHRTQEGAFTAAADGMLASDSMLLLDATPSTQIERLLGSLRSDAGLWAASGPLSAGVEATALQDLRADQVGNGLLPDRRLFGPEARPMPARLPAAFAQLAPVVLGPVAISGEFSAARFESIGGASALERDTGYAPTDDGAHGLAPIATADPLGLARGSVVRLDASPRISMPLPAGLPIWARVEAGARADAWLFDGDAGRDTRRVYGLADASTGTMLSRGYGSYLHTIAPSIELRALSSALRSGGAPIGDPGDAGGSTYSSNPDAALQGLAPGIATEPGAGGDTRGVPASRRAYDEIDSAAPDRGAGEASVRLLQSLWSAGAKGHAPARVASLELRQDFVLWLGGGHARPGEASLAAQLNLGPLTTSAIARYDWTQRTFTAVSGAAIVSDTRGDDLHFFPSVLNGSQNSRLRAGIDELFAAVRQAPVLAPSYGNLAVGAGWVIPATNGSLRFSADENYLIAAGLPFDSILRTQLAWETPCHCAGFVFGADSQLNGFRPVGAPTIRVLIDLKALGSLSTF